jgi:replicative DNA helicase
MVELNIAKNRDNPVGMIKYRFQPTTQRFTELDVDHA